MQNNNQLTLAIVSSVMLALVVGLVGLPNGRARRAPAEVARHEQTPKPRGIEQVLSAHQRRKTIPATSL
jgi:hypothetical protein